MGKRYIDLPDNLYRRNFCNVCYMEGKIAIVYKVFTKGMVLEDYMIYAFENDIRTRILRCREPLNRVRQYFKEYREQGVDNFIKIAMELCKISQIFYVKDIMGAFMIDQLADELCNEFYEIQYNSDFQDTKAQVEIFIQERMEVILKPFIEKCCELYTIPTNKDYVYNSIIKAFRLEIDSAKYKSQGRRGTPIDKINLTVTMFKKLIELKLSGKMQQDYMMEDFFADMMEVRQRDTDEIRELYYKKIIRNYNKIEKYEAWKKKNMMNTKKNMCREEKNIHRYKNYSEGYSDYVLWMKMLGYKDYLKEEEYIKKIKDLYYAECEEKYRYELYKGTNEKYPLVIVQSFLELILLEIHRFFINKPEYNLCTCTRCGQPFVADRKDQKYCPYQDENGKICNKYGKNEARKAKREKYFTIDKYMKIYDQLHHATNREPNDIIKRKNKENLAKWSELSKYNSELEAGKITEERYRKIMKEKYWEIFKKELIFEE